MSSKLREALRQVSRVAVEMTRKTITGEPEDRKTVDGWALRLCDIASEALAEPVRNCDVGTAEEQAKRFKNYCNSKVCKRNVCHSYGYEELFHHECFPIWAQMPYETVKTKTKTNKGE